MGMPVQWNPKGHRHFLPTPARSARPGGARRGGLDHPLSPIIEFWGRVVGAREGRGASRGGDPIARGAQHEVGTNKWVSSARFVNVVCGGWRLSEGRLAPHSLAPHALVANGELGLGEGVCVAQVEQAVHVWVRESAEVFRRYLVAAIGCIGIEIIGCVFLKYFFIVPFLLGFILQPYEQISPSV